MVCKQRTILIIFAAIFLLSEMFPPWIYIDKTSSIKYSAGFHFVFSPDPEIKSYSEIKERFSLPDRYQQEDFILRKDSGRLNLQRWSVLLFMISFLIASDERKSTYKKLIVIIFALIGIVFAAVWTFSSLRR